MGTYRQNQAGLISMGLCLAFDIAIGGDFGSVI